MIRFKDSDIEEQWKSGKVDWRLAIIVKTLDVWLVFKHKFNLTITSIFRPVDPKNPNSPHPYWRGVDVRTHDMKPGLPDEAVEYLNGNFIYDPTRPEMMVALRHDTGQGNHLHLQSHLNTIRKFGKVPKGMPKREQKA